MLGLLFKMGGFLSQDDVIFSSRFSTSEFPGLPLHFSEMVWTFVAALCAVAIGAGLYIRPFQSTNVEPSMHISSIHRAIPRNSTNNHIAGCRELLRLRLA